VIKRIATALVISFLSFHGCAPLKEQRVVVEPRAHVKPLFPVQLVDQKIDWLEQTSKREDLTESERAVIAQLLKTYNLVKRVAFKPMTEEEYRVLSESLFQSLTLIDETSLSEKHQSALSRSDAINLFARKREKILSAYRLGDSKTVIRESMELKTILGPEALIPEVALVLALALAKEGMEQEAIELAEGIVDELKGRPDLGLLLIHIAKWHLNLGDKAKAQEIYERLADELAEERRLLTELRENMTTTVQPIPREGGATGKEPPLSMEPLQPESQMGKVLQRVDSLVEKHEYDQAKLLLIRYRLRHEEDPELAIIERALRNVERSERVHEKEQLSKEAYRQEMIEIAKGLIEQEEYQEALEKLHELQQAQGMTSESEALQERAVEGVINRERNRAAKLFLAARKTNDPAKKEEYLRACYEILKPLVDKYPSSPLNEKIKSHIQRVEEELDLAKRKTP